MQVILWEKRTGYTTVTTPVVQDGESENDAIERVIATRGISNYHVVDGDNLPSRKFRDAWQLDGSVDLAKARKSVERQLKEKAWQLKEEIERKKDFGEDTSDLVQQRVALRAYDVNGKSLEELEKMLSY